MRVFYERYGEGEPTSCCCRRGRSSTRGTGRCRFRTSRVTAAWSRSTAAGTAAPTGPWRGGVRRVASSPPTHSRCSTRPRPSARSWSRVSCGALWALLARCRAPGAHRTAPRSSARRSRWRRSCPSARCTPSTSLDTDEGWAKYNLHHWLRDYRDFLEFFSRSVHRAALDEADRGRHRVGARDDARDADRDHDASRLPPGSSHDLCASVRCPVLVMQGTDDAIPARASGSGSPRRRAASSSCSKALRARLGMSATRSTVTVLLASTR